MKVKLCASHVKENVKEMCIYEKPQALTNLLR